MGRPRGQKGSVKLVGKNPKKWEGRWYEYVKDENGKEKRIGPRTKILGAKTQLTKGEAEEALQHHLKTIPGANGIAIPNAKIRTFEDAAKLYLKIKQGQWEGYGFHGVVSSLLETHVYPIIGQRPVDEIVKTELLLMLNTISKNGSRSESLLKKIRTHVAAVFEMCVDDKIIHGNPARKMPLPKHKDVDGSFYELDKIHALLAAATIHGTRRDVLFVKIQCGLGLRVGEQVALRLDDVGLDELRLDEMLVRVKNPRRKNASDDTAKMPSLPPVKNRLKTINSKKPVPITPKLRKEILDYARHEGLTHPREFLFQSMVGTPLDPDNYLDRVLKPIAKEAGFDRIDFRTLRRSCSTNHGEVNKGQIENTAALLRHDAATALKNYKKPVQASVREAAAKWYEKMDSYTLPAEKRDTASIQ
jgi:integrase